MLNIVLFEPEIPQNTGNIARTCAVTGTRLHLIKPLGFDISDKAVKRAGLDYWHLVDVRVYENLDDFFQKTGAEDIWLATTKAPRSYTEAVFRDECYLVFGKETAGLPEAFRRAHADRCIRIPIRAEARCLNLSNAAAILTYEALRQLDFPGLTGEEFITRIRRGRTMPIIVLSAKAGLEDRVNVLRLGADDFIPKPFDNAEVLARVEAQLRRYKQFSGGGGSAVLTHGDLTLDREGVTVTAAGKPVTVTAREFDILTLLMEHPKKVFTREQLYEQVWGGEYMGDDNTVNVHISNLRAKLAKASPAEYIKTVWGIGFKMSDL